MKTNEINNLLTEFLDMIQSDSSKIELLIKAKSIKRLIASAKVEAKELNEDSQDEISLDFGQKFFEVLKG